jgi:hypothetical protein
MANGTQFGARSLEDRRRRPEKLRFVTANDHFDAFVRLLGA